MYAILSNIAVLLLEFDYNRSFARNAI